MIDLMNLVLVVIGAGAFAYADDVVLLVPSASALRTMLDIVTGSEKTTLVTHVVLL